MKLITLKKLSEQKSISIYTLRKFVNQGLPHFLNGRKILVEPDEFDDWFRNNFSRTIKGSGDNGNVDSVVEDFFASIN